MKTLADLGPTKLQPEEQAQVREAADALFFCERVEDQDAIAALQGTLELVDRLVASERWTDERAAQLVRDLEACGPAALVA
jgi:hypothetical protein